MQSHRTSHHGLDSQFFSNNRGIWAVKWSFFILITTTMIQAVVVYFSGSVALLTDMIHNLGDAFTAIPLALAFSLGKRKPTKRFNYGLGRLEDIAGFIIVATVFLSGIFAGYASIERFFNPQIMTHLWAVALASIIGFLGNEIVAMFRIKVGKQIGSAALIADGYHARVDGLTSLGVLISVIGVYFGYPIVDPIIGLIMTGMIFKIVFESAVSVFTRMLDGVDPLIIDQIKEEISKVKGVEEVGDCRVRWIGHRLYAEVSITVNQQLSVVEGHNIAIDTHHELIHHLPFLADAIIHVDPSNLSGETCH